MSTEQDEQRCLHCSQTKAEIRRHNTFCGTVTGYEVIELDEEWPRHRWVDWNDKDLAQRGIKPEAFERHRRTPEPNFQWVACDDTVRGHSPITEKDMDLFSGIPVGTCGLCGEQAAVAA